MEAIMKKNTLFSILLCVGLVLPGAIFASQGWAEYDFKDLSARTMHVIKQYYLKKALLAAAVVGGASAMYALYSWYYRDDLPKVPTYGLQKPDLTTLDSEVNLKNVAIILSFDKSKYGPIQQKELTTVVKEYLCPIFETFTARNLTVNDWNDFIEKMKHYNMVLSKQENKNLWLEIEQLLRRCDNKQLLENIKKVTDEFIKEPEEDYFSDL